MAQRATIWELKPPTRAKHEILRRYLEAWTPILSQGGFPHLLYIDGFAGPGSYSQGEDGSPIIALRVALQQCARISANVHFRFVERDAARARILEEIISAATLPRNFHVHVHAQETFEEAFKEIQRDFRQSLGRLPPTFAFIDPFGWKGVPFSIVRAVLGRPSCEVLITFMYEEINRFLSHGEQPENFDSFFGTSDWRTCLAVQPTRSRNRCLHDLYARQLNNVADARHVRSFEMRNDADVIDYYLFYATNSETGLRKMKAAMWKVDESGEFRFSDATEERQLTLFQKVPDLTQLRAQLISHFSGLTVDRGEVEDFVVTKTAFRETDYKGILKELELSNPPVVTVVNAPPKRKPGTFASSSLRLRFR
jgi:three-Cys-motif partner protein